MLNESVIRVRLAFGQPAEPREHVERISVAVLILHLQVHVDVGACTEQPSPAPRETGVALRCLLVVVTTAAAAASATCIGLTAEIVLNAQIEVVAGRPVRRRLVKGRASPPADSDRESM